MTGEQFTKDNEGLRLTPYLCPAGKLSVGYGHNLEAHSITENQAEEYFKADYTLARTAVNTLLRKLTLDDVRRRRIRRASSIPSALDDVRRAALYDMAYQMGGAGLAKFVNMWAAIRKSDWDTAADEALDSAYATQTPRRALKVAHMLRTGTWPEE